jgi:hypothetical protein
MFNKVSALLASSLVFTGPVFAGELGVTNSYGHSFREGTGTTNIQWTTNSQLTEQSVFGAIKIEKSSFDGKENNGFGNGDQDAPGNSGGKNKAENAGGSLAGSFTDKALAASFGFGTRNYTEDTSAKGVTDEVYSFGSTNFTHSVGVFSR